MSNNLSDPITMSQHAPQTTATAGGIISDKVLHLFAQKESVSARVAQQPTAEISKKAEELYGANGYRVHHGKHLTLPGTHPVTQADLDRAAQCGNFPYRPSDLFLQVYAQVLRLLEHDPLASLVSPPLLASSGVVTLSVVSVIPDIMRHYADVIVQAQKEVFLATNYWESSTPAKIVVDALHELNRRAGKDGRKVVVKLVYDRGNIHQIKDPHQIARVEEYTAKEVQLPHPDSIPNLSLEVLNYHKPPLGTMHGKWMVVDRRTALINSNNIQDMVNLEMMTHVEGDIVEAFYDLSLLVWHKAMHPPLPLINQTPTPRTEFDFGDQHAQIQNQDLAASKSAAIQTLKDGEFPAHRAQEQGKGDRLNTYEQTPGDEERTDEADFTSKGGSKMAAITKRLNMTLNPDTKGTDLEEKDMADFAPHILHKPIKPFPIAMVNRKPRGSLDYKDIETPQDIAWIAAMHFATKSVFIQTPTFTAPPVVEAVMQTARRGIKVELYVCLGYDDSGEAMPKQGGTNEHNMVEMFKNLEDKHKQNLHVYWYTAKDMLRPMNASKKKRNCHIKIMIVDGHLGIQGSGNQDAQSWFHSLEGNIMVDSQQTCDEWRAGLDTNQNTLKYGVLDKDGIWRDPKDGSELEDAGNTSGGAKMLFKGIKGTIARVQGKGGF